MPVFGFAGVSFTRKRFLKPLLSIPEKKIIQKSGKSVCHARLKKCPVLFFYGDCYLESILLWEKFKESHLFFNMGTFFWGFTPATVVSLH
jgi:hypothetical protein